MSRVYSSLLARDTFSAGGSTLFTVPPGQVWVVRSLAAVCDAVPGQHTAGGFSFSQNGANTLFAVAAPYAVAGWQYHLDTRQVLNPADVLYLTAAEGGWSLYASGYDLTLP